MEKNIISNNKGSLITFEGIDGAGKSSHIASFSEKLILQGYQVVISREPGGTPLGEKLRDIILNDQMDPATEALLVFAARQEHVAKVIAPAINDGKLVVSDRFTDATFAYQGYGRGFSLEKLAILEQWVHPDLQPTLTVIFDCDPEIAAQRLANSRLADKFESESLQFFIRVRNGYLERAALHPERYIIIDSNQTIDDVKDQISQIVSKFAR